MPLVSDFLIDRLENAGLKHCFGIPGDYCLDFYDKLWNSSIKVINNTDESHAGFAADAYARIAGIGAVCVTYNVGSLKVANAIACAYAERSPVVLLCGSPGMNERREGMLLHHMVKSFECQYDIFKNITCASTVLSNPLTAGYEIDRVLETLKIKKQPIYIEIPRDIAKKPIDYDVYKTGTFVFPKTDEDNLSDALQEIVSWVKNSKNPVILAGVEIARYNLSKALVAFAEKNNLPVVTTLLSKSVIDETHPLFAGVYAGHSSENTVFSLVEESDCLIMFGDILTDMVGYLPTKFKKRQVIVCSMEELRVKNHNYEKINFIDFCKEFFKMTFERNESKVFNNKSIPVFKSDSKNKVTIKRFFDKINSILDENMCIVADVGDSLFGSMDLVVHDTNNFLSPAFYLSMGFAIPGALGVQIANPNIRPIVLVGDGAFQMTVSEISTILGNNLNPIIFVLNNKGYTTEKFLKKGDFNNIRNWNYHNIHSLFCGGKGYVVQTEEDLDVVVQECIDNKEVSVVNLLIEESDISDGLKRTTEFLSKLI